MRYADGGALTAQGRSRRKRVRLQAAKMFAKDADAREVARSLRVSAKSVTSGGGPGGPTAKAALASKGAGLVQLPAAAESCSADGTSPAESRDIAFKLTDSIGPTSLTGFRYRQDKFTYSAIYRQSHVCINSLMLLFSTWDGAERR